MRIAHILLTKRFAGSERYAIELANAQAREHDVAIILRKAAAQDRSDALAWRVDPAVRQIIVSDWLTRGQVRRALRQLQPDVAHAHLSDACKALRGMDGLCLRVATLHICYKPQQHAHLDALVAIAPWQMEGVDTRLRPRTIQIDNWTSAQAVSIGARGALREQHGIEPDAWVFGAVGRVEPSKGFDRLVKAFQRARFPESSPTYLVIVGQGSQLQTLRRHADRRILFPGFSSNPERWLAAFDCFVSPSRSEPFGLVFLEAMEAGLPIMATRSEGALHLAADIDPGWVPMADISAFARLLEQYATLKPERRRYPMERYRIESRLVQFDKFYTRELAGQI